MFRPINGISNFYQGAIHFSREWVSSVTGDSLTDDSSTSMPPLVKTGSKEEIQASLAKRTDTRTCAWRMHAAETADPEVSAN